MKIIVSLLVSTLPLGIRGLLVHSPSVIVPPRVNIPTLACSEEDQDEKSAYDTAYLRSFYEAISTQLAHADKQILEEFSKSDVNGDGELDCSELVMIKRQYDTTGKESDKNEEDKQKDEHDASPPEHASQLIANQRGESPLHMAKADALADAEVAAAHRSTRIGKRTLGDAVNGGEKEECKPKCTWTCGTRTCDEVCSPKCNTPQCQTRCTGMATTGCVMKCGQPRCSSICQTSPCAKKDCPACKTQCSKPLCKLVCPAGVQNCHDVCESPACSWICKKPAVCPKPACKLDCDSPRACKEGGYKALPTLKNGETVVQSFEMPLTLRQLTDEAGLLTLPVPVTQAFAVPGSSELKMKHSTLRLPVVMDE